MIARPISRNLRAFFFTLMSGAVYFASVSVFTGGAFLATSRAGLSSAAAAAVILLGTALGIAAGIAICFACSPWMLKNTLQARPLQGQDEDGIDAPGSLARIQGEFELAGLPAPDVYLVPDTKALGSPGRMNVLVTGLGRQSRGVSFLKPALFISETCLRGLTSNELHAVVCHEIGHIRLHHLLKRIAFAAVTLLSILFVGSATLFASIFAAKALGVGGEADAFIGLTVGAAAFAAAHWLLGRHSQKQELEADRHALLKSRIPGGDLISAIEKLGLRHSPDLRERVARALGIESHPAPGARVERIREAA